LRVRFPPLPPYILPLAFGELGETEDLILRDPEWKCGSTDSEKRMNSDEVLFFESFVAAQSLKSVWTRAASTYGCIMVVLSRETLTIRPHWFAKWAISLLGLDLCHEIPITNIRNVTETGKWFRYGKVELHFVTMDGDDQNILLYMKKYREFIDTVKDTIPQ
jgi:hypothetical protein